MDITETWDMAVHVFYLRLVCDLAEIVGRVTLMR